MTLVTAWQNAIWRIEALTPTESAIVAEPFDYVDSERLDPATLRHRSFSVQWDGSDEDAAPTDLYDRFAQHRMTLSVFYRVGVGGLRVEDAHKAFLSDRHDILRCLRDPGKFDGYDDSNTATVTGLEDRRREEDELIQQPNVWIYRARWACKVRETEY